MRVLVFASVLGFFIAGCGGSDPTGPQVITNCEAPVSVTCTPGPGPSATANASGAPPATAAP